MYQKREGNLSEKNKRKKKKEKGGEINELLDGWRPAAITEFMYGCQNGLG